MGYKVGEDENMETCRTLRHGRNVRKILAGDLQRRKQSFGNIGTEGILTMEREGVVWR